MTSFSLGEVEDGLSSSRRQLVHFPDSTTNGQDSSTRDHRTPCPYLPVTSMLEQRVVFINYLGKGRAITGPYYAVLLDRLVEEIRKKQPHLQKKKILFYDSNALSHTSNIAQTKRHELGFELLPPLSYSPDLVPNEYYLFPHLKRWLCGRRFESNEEVEWETEGYFEGFDKSYYLEGIEKLDSSYQSKRKVH